MSNKDTRATRIESFNVTFTICIFEISYNNCQKKKLDDGNVHCFWNSCNKTLTCANQRTSSNSSRCSRRLLYLFGYFTYVQFIIWEVLLAIAL